jgi:multidrug efflux pump subunit AcrB
VAEKHQITLEFGGEAEESSSSNDALLKTLPIGAILLCSALILQFNSFRIAGLILLTIPLAMIGVKPTLGIVGVNFGFMLVLGLLALTGIVVNIAIILIDTVLVKIKVENYSLITAIELATRDISTRTIIGGLIIFTILTLIILPACLKLTLNEEKIRGNKV